MPQTLPHPDFPTVKMMSAVEELTHKGNMKLQEVTARATNETLKEVFIAGYQQCMRDFGLTEESPTDAS